jgi:hypothetical protein
VRDCQWVLDARVPSVQAMDFVSVALALVAFALLIASVEAVDRI